jgi:glycosyltransferase involved in cell wall biosynthesis
MIRFAFGSVPKDGGTFTFYRNLRPALLDYGIDMRCVAVGKMQSLLWEQAYVDDGCVLLAPTTRDIKRQSMLFAEWCKQENIDLVMGINSEAILSALPHLPEHIRVLARCANGFEHGYRITMAGKERLARIIAITPRLHDDLINHYGANPAIVHLIPNGINPQPFEKAAITPRGQTSTVHLGFLGRLEHRQKGVFHLPRIVRELNARGVSFRLRIAGKGKHREVLEREMSTEIESGQVEFIGQLTPQQIPGFLAETDIFIFTSHFEGCPNSLLEAMMAGCVTVSWLIEGITDFILEDGKTGLICPNGDYTGFVLRIESLSKDKNKLQTMSLEASRSARIRFSQARVASKYAALFNQVMNDTPPRWMSKPWEEFRADPNFEHGWKEWFRALPIARWAMKKAKDSANLDLSAR